LFFGPLHPSKKFRQKLFSQLFAQYGGQTGRGENVGSVALKMPQWDDLPLIGAYPKSSSSSLCSDNCVSCQGPGRPTAWPEQSQVVVETVTKTSTTQKFATVQQVQESDATKVTATGAGLQHATANHEATFTVDTSHGGMLFLVCLRVCSGRLINSANIIFWLYALISLLVPVV